MIEFICEVLGYTMYNGSNQNYDSYIYAAAAMLMVTLFILVEHFLLRFVQGLWRMIK